MNEPRQRTLTELAQEAMDVQNACNLSGVALGFGRAMIDLRHIVNGMINTHPIAVLWSDKIASLTGTQYADIGIGIVIKAYNAVDAILAEANTPVADVRRA